MSRRPPTAAARRRHRRWALTGGAAAVVVVAAAAAAGIAIAAPSSSGADDPSTSVPTGSIAFPEVTPPTSPPATPPAGGSSRIQLGAGGFTVLPTEASTWVARNPGDARMPVIRDRIATKASALWLTGDESYGNLSYAVSQAQRNDGTLTLTLYNIPGRNDGLTGPTDVTPAQYRSFIDRVVTTLGSTRAVVVVEPDALWFVDRQTPPGTQAYTDRMALLNYVVDSFRAHAPRSYVYLEAGTSSQSVTPQRMAQLLRAAGVAKAAGFAVDVSSFGPEGPITAWAGGIRSALASLGVSDAHYVVDTSRNGNPSWDYTWCNPSARKIGFTPGLANGADGRDANLWIKQPGTSDGNCGNGPGSYGGQFLPQVAYDQAS
ncbi:glycoside hydrolase family 6 protein [Jatrophihabitans sp. YIM 134969]